METNVVVDDSFVESLFPERKELRRLRTRIAMFLKLATDFGFSKPEYLWMVKEPLKPEEPWYTVCAIHDGREGFRYAIHPIRKRKQEKLMGKTYVTRFYGFHLETGHWTGMNRRLDPPEWEEVDLGTFDKSTTVDNFEKAFTRILEVEFKGWIADTLENLSYDELDAENEEMLARQ